MHAGRTMLQLLATAQDRTRGRSFGADVADAARLEEVDPGYMSGEDTIAVLFQYDDGSQAYELGMAERLINL